MACGPVRQPYAGVDLIPKSEIYEFGHWSKNRNLVVLAKDFTSKSVFYVYLGLRVKRCRIVNKTFSRVVFAYGYQVAHR
jgi:hypothetical protein